MLHKKIQMTRTMAHGILDELGKMPESVQFIDLRKEDIETKRDMVTMISRCDKMEQLFIKFEKLCVDHNVEIVKYENYQKLFSNLEEDISFRHGRTNSLYFDLIENEVQDDSKKLDELIASYDEIKDAYSTLLEKRAVYEKSVELFKTSQMVRTGAPYANESQQRMLEEGLSDLNYIAGVTKADDELRMKRMIFRISKGRALAHFFNMPKTNEV
jgi:V-type H+-transporting ATPase subunit a